jgi:hypothetical protein
MNKYGDQAMKTIRDFDPDRFGAIPEASRTAYFQALGLEIQGMVSDLSFELAGPDKAGEGYLEKVGRLNAAKLQAEEMAMNEMVYSTLPPDEDDEVDPETALTLDVIDQTYAAIQQLYDEWRMNEDAPPAR